MVVALWEACAHQDAQERALSMLGAVEADLDRDQLARLPLGERDRRLLCLHRSQYGDTIQAIDACPDCGERIELEISVGSLLDELPEPGPCETTLGEFTVTFRPVTTEDLLAVRRAPDSAQAERQLRARIVTAASRAGVSISSDQLSEAEIAALSLALDAADPMAEILLSAQCPACERGWSSLLEIAELLFGLLAREAQRVLVDVHALASAYGWTEDVVLALSEQRRRWYVARVGG